MALPCGTKDNEPATAGRQREEVSGDSFSAGPVVAEAARGGIFPNSSGEKIPPREHPRDLLIRWWAFAGLVALALLITAGVVLLPAFARIRQLEHQNACQEVRLREARATIAAMDRFLAQAPTDEVLTKRLAWSKLGLLPVNESWPLHTAVPPPPPPGTLSPIRYPDPPAPDAPVDRWAKKVQSPVYRRGLLVLAASMIVAAILLFPASRSRTPAVTAAK